MIQGLDALIKEHEQYGMKEFSKESNNGISSITKKTETKMSGATATVASKKKSLKTSPHNVDEVGMLKYTSIQLKYLYTF